MGKHPHEILITAGKKGILVSLRELVEYRELIIQLVRRDLKVRYRQTVLGVLWAGIQPGLTALIFTIVFSRVSNNELREMPYWMFALSGFTFWTFANASVNFASGSLVHHKELVTKIYFPRAIVPLSAVGAYFVDLALTLLIMLVVFAIGGLAFGIYVLWLPLVVFYLLFVVVAVSLLFASINVRFRDVKFMVPFMIQVWLFLTPVFYPATWIPEKWQYVFALNPLFGCFNALRYVLFGAQLDIVTLCISILSAVVLFGFSVTVFRKTEPDFADII